MGQQPGNGISLHGSPGPLIHNLEGVWSWIRRSCKLLLLSKISKPGLKWSKRTWLFELTFWINNQFWRGQRGGTREYLDSRQNSFFLRDKPKLDWPFFQLFLGCFCFLSLGTFISFISYPEFGLNTFLTFLLNVFRTKRFYQAQFENDVSWLHYFETFSYQPKCRIHQLKVEFVMRLGLSIIKTI
jgi:hypothetical protein